jgi:uncharacterized membrane protein YraQ (UPF0718 family)
MKSAAQRFAVFGCCAAVMAASVWPPALALPMLARIDRSWVYASSIVLEAAPYILVGAFVAALVQCARLHPVWTVIGAMIAPTCDCMMNGFVNALSRAPAPLAAFAIVWAATCNPIALLATHAVLGNRVLIGRIVGTVMAASITALAWTVLRPVSSATFGRCRAKCPTAFELFGAGLIALAPAAVIAATVITLVPVSRVAIGVWPAAALGAVMSPCSTADAILARVLVSKPAAQTAFVLAAQMLDFRQLALLYRTFGTPRTIAAVVAAIAGCAAGIVVTGLR